MRVWTNSSFRSLDLLGAAAKQSDTLPETEDVVALLTRALAADAPCYINRAHPSQARLTMEAPMKKLIANGLLIGRPSYKPGQRGLSAGEGLHLRISLPEASYRGKTSVLAKYSLDGETARHVTFGLALPATLVIDDRRNNDRFGLAHAEQPRAEMLCPPRHKPLGAGLIVDLSTGGMRLHSQDANVRAGDRVLVRAKLADDILIHTLASVVYAGPRSDGCTDVGLRFQSEQNDIARFIRAIIQEHSIQEPRALEQGS